MFSSGSQVRFIGFLTRFSFAKRWYHHSRYAYSLLFSTGPAKYATLIKQAADEKGFAISETGMTRKDFGEDDDPIPEMASEADIFEFLDMEFVDPDMRLALVSEE
jgi:DNA polymerase/3'-5' exonuclease PolX